jgi:hypothetical protein
MSVRRAGISARLALLDHQLLDADGLPIGRVDDLELSLPPSGGAPEVEAVLTGAEALGQRLGGLTGALMAAVASRLRPTTGVGPTRLDAELVEELEPAIKLRLALRELPGVAALERWLGQRVERVPGSGRAID